MSFIFVENEGRQVRVAIKKTPKGTWVGWPGAPETCPGEAFGRPFDVLLAVDDEIDLSHGRPLRDARHHFEMPGSPPLTGPPQPPPCLHI